MEASSDGGSQPSVSLPVSSVLVYDGITQPEEVTAEWLLQEQARGPEDSQRRPLQPKL